MNRPFQGTIAPVITPYRADQSLDLTGVEAVFAYFDNHPAIEGLFITGATGDYDVLTLPERKMILDIACKMDIRTDWIPNTSTRERGSSLELTKYAASKGVEAVGVIFPKECHTFDDVLSFLRAILSLGVRVFIYQTGNTPYALSPEELKQILQLNGVVGMKDSCSGRDMYRHIRYLSEYGDKLTVIQGVEMLYLPSLSMGSKGVIGGGLNVYPQLLGKIRERYARGDTQGAARMQATVNSLFEQLSAENTGLGSMKYFLSINGVPIGTASRKAEPALSEEKKVFLHKLSEQLSDEWE